MADAACHHFFNNLRQVPLNYLALSLSALHAVQADACQAMLSKYLIPLFEHKQGQSYVC